MAISYQFPIYTFESLEFLSLLKREDDEIFDFVNTHQQLCHS